MFGLAIALLLILVGGLAGYAAYSARRVEAAAPPLGRFLEIDGARIHYVDKGAGPALFMIHGLAGQLRNFTYSLVDRLAGEFRVVAVDRPGSGYSTPSADASAGLRAQAATLAKVIAALNLERPVIVGHSMGGAIALAVALDHPDRVGALALIAPLTQVMRAPPPAFRGLDIPWAGVRWIAAWTLAIPVAMITSRRALKEVFAPERTPADFGTAGGALLGLRPAAFNGASSDLTAANRDLEVMSPRYGSLRVPVGILAGRGDHILDYQVQDEVLKQQILDLDLEIVDGGHMLPVTQPGVCADFIRRTAKRARR
jgi:pimeloyl-ACP methyl ester carboxylesterase